MIKKVESAVGTVVGVLAIICIIGFLIWLCVEVDKLIGGPVDREICRLCRVEGIDVVNDQVIRLGSEEFRFYVNSDGELGVWSDDGESVYWPNNREEFIGFDQELEYYRFTIIYCKGPRIVIQKHDAPRPTATRAPTSTPSFILP